MIIYETRYKAYKHKKGDEVVVKVEGGYMVIKATDYRTWKGQK